MARKTLAEHVADIMNEEGSTVIDVGYQGVLSEAYARSRGTSELAPWHRNRLVTRALAGTKSGKRLFHNRGLHHGYRGIINGYINVFELREEYRRTPSVAGAGGEQTEKET